MQKRMETSSTQSKLKRKARWRPSEHTTPNPYLSKNLKTTNFLNTIPMELKQATAGTMESGDIMIQIAPCEKEGLNIDLQSSVAYQFGDQIRKVIAETIEGLGITRAEVHATDKSYGQRRVERLTPKNFLTYETTKKNYDVRAGKQPRYDAGCIYISSRLNNARP